MEPDRVASPGSRTDGQVEGVEKHLDVVCRADRALPDLTVIRDVENHPVVGQSDTRELREEVGLEVNRISISARLEEIGKSDVDRFSS